METSDLLLWGGIGLAAYWLLSGSSSTAAATTTAAPAATGSGTSTAASAAPTQAQVTLALLQSIGSAPVLLAAKNGNGGLPSGLLNMGQWNWYVGQVSGIYPPDISAFIPVDPTGNMTISQYWAGLMAWAQQQVQNAAAASISPTGVAGLGSASQPGQGVNSNFPAPGNNVDGRYDFADLGWN